MSKIELFSGSYKNGGFNVFATQTMRLATPNLNLRK